MTERLSDEELARLLSIWTFGMREHPIASALTELTERRAREVWRPIESHPKSGLVWACIWHGDRYAVVVAECFPVGVHDQRDGSCVGWRSGHKPKRPAFWQPINIPSAPEIEVQP